MPYRRFDWHEHIQEVRGEYWTARAAVDRLRDAINEDPGLFGKLSDVRKYLKSTHLNLEGTYIVRLFAAFEAALRSYDQASHNDPTRMTDAGTMIDELGGKRNRGIQISIRQRAQEVRRVRNFRAHEADVDPGPMTIEEARSRLQRYLSELPEEW